MDVQKLEMLLEIMLVKESSMDSKQEKQNRELLKTFIIRGFFNTLEILKGEFLENLQQFGLLEKLFSFLLKETDQSVLPKEDRVSTYLLESRADYAREKVMSGYDLSFNERNLDREIDVVGAKKNAIWIRLEENEPWSFKLKKKFGKDADDCITERIVRPGKFIQKDEDDLKKIGLLNSSLLLVLDRQTLSFLKKVDRIITDD